MPRAWVWFTYLWTLWVHIYGHCNQRGKKVPQQRHLRLHQHFYLSIKPVLEWRDSWQQWCFKGVGVNYLGLGFQWKKHLLKMGTKKLTFSTQWAKNSEFILVNATSFRKKLFIKYALPLCAELNRVRPFMTPWTVAHQAPLSTGFSGQEYWSGLPFPYPGDLTYPGIEPCLLHCRQVLYRLSYKGRTVIFIKNYPISCNLRFHLL